MYLSPQKYVDYIRVKQNDFNFFTLMFPLDKRKVGITWTYLYCKSSKWPLKKRTLPLILCKVTLDSF